MMSQCKLPEYMRQGRLVPLSKVKESNNVKVEDIRPIVVRSHLSKIVEKALLERIKKHSWHLLETQYYQTGFKDGQSTAANMSRILYEVHGRTKRKFNLLIDLQKAYDTVDREKLFDILYNRCKNDTDRALVNLMKEIHSDSSVRVGRDH
jgi:hypothetical protein